MAFPVGLKDGNPFPVLKGSLGNPGHAWPREAAGEGCTAAGSTSLSPPCSPASPTKTSASGSGEKGLLGRTLLAGPWGSGLMSTCVSEGAVSNKQHSVHSYEVPPGRPTQSMALMTNGPRAVSLLAYLYFLCCLSRCVYLTGVDAYSYGLSEDSLQGPKEAT